MTAPMTFSYIRAALLHDGMNIVKQCLLSIES